MPLHVWDFALYQVSLDIQADIEISRCAVLQVLRCLRVDRVTVGITRYVIAKLGDRYVQPPVLDYASIYLQSTEMTPIVFVLSPGADPAFDIFKLGGRWLRKRISGLLLWCCVEVDSITQARKWASDLVSS